MQKSHASQGFMQRRIKHKTMPTPERNLIISDPQDITRYALRAMADKMRVFGSVTDADTFAAMIACLQNCPEAVCVIDYTLLDVNAERLLIAAERFPRARFILFSDTLTGRFVRRMTLAAKSFGVVMKGSSLEEITRALAAAAQGSRFLCDYARAAIDREREIDAESPLTPTERDILREIAFGLTSKQIAAKHSLSTYTVVTHRKNIFRKLGVNNAHEATRYALRTGIATPAEYYI